jgi:hypothetical protein
VGSNRGQITEPHWLGSGGVLFTVVQPSDDVPKEDIVYVGPGGTSKVIRAQTDGLYGIEVSPTSGTAAYLILDGVSDRALLEFVDQKGITKPSVTLPWIPDGMRWSGDDLYLAHSGRTSAGVSSTILVFKQGRLSPADSWPEAPLPTTSSLTPSAIGGRPPQVTEGDPKKTLEAFASTLELPVTVVGTSRPSIGIVTPPIKAGETEDVQAGIVSTDVGAISLSPDSGAVAYISQGILMVRELIPVNKQLLMDARDAAARTEALNKVKQVGLAVLMYAGDNDDNYPPNQGFADSVSPYLKNNSLLNGYNYVFNGGNATDVENPASTMLGFLDCPGGRAVVYADGHAKFVANPK